MPPWLVSAYADKAAGVKEIDGPRAHSRIVEMHQYTTLKATSDEIAWCSSGMCAWMEENGIVSTRSAAARSWHKWGTKLEKPVYGCVVVLWRGGSRDPNVTGPGHVAIYLESVGASHIRVIGGNQSDAVTVDEMKIADLFSYRWPKGFPMPS
jgi:uncharacterized protein (TIGR02594 family)